MWKWMNMRARLSSVRFRMMRSKPNGTKMTTSWRLLTILECVKMVGCKRGISFSNGGGLELGAGRGDSAEGSVLQNQLRSFSRKLPFVLRLQLGWDSHMVGTIIRQIWCHPTIPCCQQWVGICIIWQWVGSSVSSPFQMVGTTLNQPLEDLRLGYLFSTGT